MSDVSTLNKPTLESLAAEVLRLQERMEDMEDLMELRAVVERNSGKGGGPPSCVGGSARHCRKIGTGI